MDNGEGDGSVAVVTTHAHELQHEMPMVVDVPLDAPTNLTQASTPPPLSPTETTAIANTETIVTSGTANKLLATDESSQENMSQNDEPAEDVFMKDQPKEEVSLPELPRFEELPTGGDVAMDGRATVDGEATLNNETPSATENAAEKEAEALTEHPALAHERRWFGELPAFVRSAYDDPPTATTQPQGQEQKHSGAIDQAFPMCKPCADTQRRALSSVVCMDKTCSLKEKPMCSSCFMNEHTSLTAMTHPLRITKACPHCHTSRVNVWCGACDLAFCRECFVGVHGGVKRAKNHKIYRVDGVTGKLFVRSNWSPYFRQAILEIQDEQLKIAKNTANVNFNDPRLTSTASTAPPPFHGKHELKVTLKRKRTTEPPEVICIDDDDDDSAVQPSRRPTSPPASVFEIASSQSLENHTLQQPPLQIMATPIPPVPNVMIDQAHMTRAGYITDVAVTPPPIAPGAHNFVPIATCSVSSPTAMSMPAMALSQPRSVSTPWTSSPMVTTSTAAQMAVTVDVGSPTGLTVSNLSLGAGNVMEQNPIEQVLYDRLNRVNNNIGGIERLVAELNGKVVQASYQSVQTAHNLMTQLQKHQLRLVQLRNKRDAVVVQLVAQSRSIINKVKHLRLDLLGDIPQVQVACYRRCIELSMMIKQAEAVIISLNERMNETLEQVDTVSNEVFHRTVSSVSTAIQSQEQEVTRRREEREDEIVRLVQYHRGVRETLTRAVQQQQHVRHQQEQQQGQQQQQQHVHQPQQQEHEQQHQPQQLQQVHQQQQQQLDQQMLRQEVVQQQQQQHQQQQSQPPHQQDLHHLQKQLYLQHQQIQQRFFTQQQLQQQQQQIHQPISTSIHPQPIPMPPYIGSAPPSQLNGGDSYENPPVSRP